MVEPIRTSTRQEREEWIRQAHYNLFQLPAEQVYIDLLTDSGTGAMSDRQWSAMMMGDESYAGARSFFRLRDAIHRITGFEYVIPTHQGRAAENVLFSALVKAGDIVPGNSHFDTTKGHIESRKAFAVDCTIDEAKDTQLEHPFKGNVDIAKLDNVLAENADKVPFVIVTITNNTAGGQPVSLQNLRDVRAICDKYGKPLVLDSARFAENAYFIKTREEGQEGRSIKEIVLDTFALADAMTMSAKKDAIVNMGGFIATRRAEWYEAAKVYCIPFEGYLTYGGMNGRDMEALAVGLDENTEFDSLHTRIHQVQFLASLLDEYGVPYQRPAGGHAIFVVCLEGAPQYPQTRNYPVPRQNAHCGALQRGRNPLLRNRLYSCRPRPCDARKPFRRPRPASSGYPAPCVHRQPHGCYRCGSEECVRPPRIHHPRCENSVGG